MKKLAWLVGALCAAAAGCLVLTSHYRIEPATDALNDRTHHPEEPWHDHHTIA